MSAQSLKRILFLTGLVLVGMAVYIGYSAAFIRPGFPLDDAWIHQTYARNLMTNGRWEFQAGQPSAGSTAPLWTLMLTPGYLFSNIPLYWSFSLGAICLLALAVLGERYARDTLHRPHFPWVGLFLVAEWHLLWAAFSGMETLLFATIILASLMMLTLKTPPWFLVGLLCGLSVWIRPDGITLAGPALVILLLSEAKIKLRLLNCGKFIAGVAILVIPYVIFNLSLSQVILPTTFYAKQAEYAVTTQMPWLTRYLNLLLPPMVGGGILLLPGFIFLAWKSLQTRMWGILVAVIWWLGYTFLFSFFLPVTYQHGRYLMPAMPVYFTLGVIGSLLLMEMMKSKAFALLRFAWVVALVIVIGVFYLLGMRSYAVDVGIIETEMVATANWIRENTPENSLLAVHDIGAAGFFANRRIVDLAGLVSPEVMPFIRDEEKLIDFLDQRQVDYLVTFPGWYELLPRYGKEVFRSEGVISPGEGGENMTVYRWMGRVRRP